MRPTELLVTSSSHSWSAFTNVGDQTLLADYHKLEGELTKVKPNPMHAAYRFMETIVMHIIGLYLLSSVNHVLPPFLH